MTATQQRRRRRSFGAVRKLPSGRHQARYIGPDRQQYAADHTFATEAAADKWLAGVRTDIDRGTWVSPAVQRAAEEAARRDAVTFAEYATPWPANRRSSKGVRLKPRTVALYDSILARDLLPVFGATPVRDITPAAVRAWFDGYGEDHATGRAHAYSLLRSIMATAVEDELRADNPCRIRGGGQSPAATRREGATGAQLEAIAAAMPAWLGAAVWLSAYCALRFGEVAELRRRDVDLTNPDVPRLKVRRAVTYANGVTIVGVPKSHAGVRNVVVPPHLAPMLAAHLEQHAQPGPDGLLFHTARGVGETCAEACGYAGCTGGHLLSSVLYKHFHPAREAAGRPDLRWHDLRHTGAVWAAAEGATLAELMARLGHSTVSAAMRYQHAASERDAEIARRMSERHAV